MNCRIRLIPLIALAYAAGVSPAAPLNFTTIPAGGVLNVNGLEPVGWGFTLQNTTSSFALPLSLSATGVGFGTLQDIFGYPVIDPGQTVSQPYVFNPPGGLGNSLGLFEYVPAPGTPPGTIQTGSFNLTFQFYTDNPDLNPEAQPIGGVQTVSAPFEIHTTADQVPEPGTAGLVALGAALLMLKLSHRQ